MVVSAPASEVVSAIMSTKVVSVKSTEKVGKALRTMVRNKIGSIVVVDKGKPVGILTERDISIRTAKGQKVMGMVVGKMMSKPLVTIGPSAQVWEAVEQMVRKDIRRLPVIEGDKIVGMVTERDVFRWVIRVAYEPNIPEDLKKLVETRGHAQVAPAL
jgi:CBS domain-containing protein